MPAWHAISRARISLLLQDEQRGAGLVYLLPVHARGTGGGPGRLVGFVHAPIVVAEILGDLQSFVEFMLDIRLYEGMPADGRALFDSQRHIDPGEVLSPDDSFEHRLHVTERQFGIGGRLFTLQVASKPALEAGVVGEGRVSVWLSAGGTLLTTLMAFAATLVLRGRDRAIRMAQRITADLEQASGDLARSNERLSAVMEGLRDSESLMRLITDNLPGRIVYWDLQGRCRFASRDFLAGHGVSAQQAVAAVVQTAQTTEATTGQVQATLGEVGRRLPACRW